MLTAPKGHNVTRYPRTLIILFTLIGISLTACGGDSEDDAGDAMRVLIERLAVGQGGRAYESLHPAHQEIIDRDLYIQCVTGIGAEVDDFEVLDSYEEDYLIPGTDLRVMSTVITYRAEFDNGRSISDTGHMIAVDGEWLYAINEPQPFIEGRCD